VRRVPGTYTVEGDVVRHSFGDELPQLGTLVMTEERVTSRH
jgi:hypothetical protein